MFMKVVLPEPVKPTIDTNSPFSTRRFTSFNTSRDDAAVVNDLETFRISTKAKEVSFCLISL